MTIPSAPIPSAGPSVLDRVLTQAPLAQLRSAFPSVVTEPGSVFDIFIISMQVLSVLLSVAIIVGIIAVIRRTRLLQEVVQTVEDVVTAELPHSDIADRWSSLQTLIASERDNDWKLAIIEADKLLEFSFRHLPFEGETLADKLKQFDRSELSVIDEVWRAHKLRNVLVHGDRDSVSQAEASSAVEAVGKALRELGALS